MTHHDITLLTAALWGCAGLGGLIRGFSTGRMAFLFFGVAALLSAFIYAVVASG